jgi:FAD/FMN-containing dehydrogenase
MSKTTTSPLTESPSRLAASLRDHGFVGRLVEPLDAGYDEARACWNGAVDRQPAAVAFATDPDDVAAAIAASRREGVPFTIRAGSHSVSGRSMRDGAICIDIRGLSSVEVDPASALVRVGGGALLSEMDAATQEHGLAVPGGQISHTGVGGLTLGGGVGWLMRNHGLTIDSLEAVEAVLADGRTIRASEEEHAELFWAVRGGGGDFAAVTKFEFRAHRVGPMILGGMMVYPWTSAPAAFRAARDLMEGAPEELTTFVTLITAPPADPFPLEVQGGPALAVAMAWSGDMAKGAQIVGGLRAKCPPAVDLVGPMPYVALQGMLDQTAPHGLHYYDRAHYLPEVSDEFIDTLLSGFDEVSTPLSHVITGWMGGAIDRVAPGETAFGHRGASALTWLIGCSGEEPVAPAAEWVRAVWERTASFADEGVYVNALNSGRSVREAYSDDVWKRLVEVKHRYDPDGVFAGNGIG